MNKLQQAREVAKSLVRTYFKNDYGEPFELTNGQADIFLMIFLKIHPRNAVMTYTQYGKSDTVSMALILRTQIFNEFFTIIAGKKRKGMIIMEKILQHVFDNSYFYNRLEIDKDMPLERLKRERSKEKITWQGGGGIRIFSANVSNRNSVKESLIGEGGQNLIEEEAPHIPDSYHSMVMRMMMGHKNSFLMKIGNAFNNNHFRRSVESDKYHKVIIDYHQGIEEGRITQEMIDEVKDLPFFRELYESKFSDDDDLIEGGYRRLITKELLDNAYISEEQFQALCTEEIKDKGGNVINKVPRGIAKLGGDFAGGGRDRSAYTIRWTDAMVMKHISNNRIADTMQQIPIIEDIIKLYDISDSEVSIDYGGLGQGIGDRLVEKDNYVNLIMFGASAPDSVKYKNMRAYMYYELFLWLKKGGKIVKDDGFNELLVVNYKEDSERKFQIQAKEELKKQMKDAGVQATSPDIADSAALTFADNSEIVTEDDFEII